MRSKWLTQFRTCYTHTNGPNETRGSFKFFFSKCTKYPKISSVNWTLIIWHLTSTSNYGLYWTETANCKKTMGIPLTLSWIKNLSRSSRNKIWRWTDTCTIIQGIILCALCKECMENILNISCWICSKKWFQNFRLYLLILMMIYMMCQSFLCRIPEHDSQFWYESVM